MPSFEGRVAVITGGGRGMGRAHARLLAAGGASVVVQDILEPEAQETVRMVREAGGQAQALICDVTDNGRPPGELAAAERRLRRVAILVDNAGVGRGGAVGES